MDMIMKNKTVFETLKQVYKELEDFTIDNNFLIFKDKKIDISKYDLELLINEEFLSSIKGKSPEEVYKVFEEKLNVNNELNNEEKLERIILENPLMKSITIFRNEDLDTREKEEFINIRTSNGENYLFKNDNNFDLFAFYYSLEKSYGDNITPDIVAREINKWSLNKLEVVDSDKTKEKEDCKESFKNKLREIEQQYNNPNIKIEANIDEEIIYVNNTANPDENIIITFERDINNELVMRVHKNNVKQTKEVKQGSSPMEEVEKIDNPTEKIVTNSISNSNIINSNMVYNNSNSTISQQRLIEIVSQDGPFSESELKEVNNFFDDVAKMINNNNPSYEEILDYLNKYIENLQVTKEEFTEREKYFMERTYKLYDEMEKVKGTEKGSQLTLKNEGAKFTEIPDDSSNNYGFSSPAPIIILITSIVVVLSILVLALF